MTMLELLHIILIVLTFCITLIFLTPLFRRLNPFWVLTSHALYELYEGTGWIKNEDRGFWIVRQAVFFHRPDIGKCEKEHGRIIEIRITTKVGLSIGSVSSGYVMPRDLARVKFEDGSEKTILKDERESGLISNWTGRAVERYTGYVIIAFVIAWTTLSLWMTLYA